MSPIGPPLYPDGTKPVLPEPVRPDYGDITVKEVHHPHVHGGGHVIITEDGGQAVVGWWHYPVGRRCECGKCRCYCKDCKEHRNNG
jgi:hypothetical protein